MKIIIDIGHPGHVHLFKNLAHRLIREGASVLFTLRDKEFERELLQAEGFEFRNFGKHYQSLPGKVWGLLKFNMQMLVTALRFRPDLFISHGSLYAAQVGWLLGKKHLSMEDTGNMEQILLYRPFTDVILTPDVLSKDLGPKQHRYAGYHELAYLHPDHFTPDPQTFSWLGLERGEPYAVVRFISWKATHDVWDRGLSDAEKRQLIAKLAGRMKVFISSEAALPPELAPLQLPTPPEKLHHVLGFAAIVISEGGTIASEAGVLGTPAIYVSPQPRDYCQDQEKYGLVFNARNFAEALPLIEQVLQTGRQVFQARRKKLLQDKINLTDFLYDFIRKHYC